MRIKNKTKNTEVADVVIEAKTFNQQLFGLIFYKKPMGMIFRTHFGIHTFFMRNPIDVIILSKKNRVAIIKKNLEPNRIFFWNPAYSMVVELPAGAIDKAKTEIGDLLSFIVNF